MFDRFRDFIVRFNPKLPAGRLCVQVFFVLNRCTNALETISQSKNVFTKALN